MSHETNKPDDPYKSVHNIKLNTINFWNWREFVAGDSQRIYGVNSRHHQSVNPRFIGEGLTVLATHEVDNTIELIAHDTLPIIACQFHVEDLMEDSTIALMDKMVARIMSTRKSILQDE